MECQNNCENDYNCILGCNRELEGKEKKCPCGQLCRGEILEKRGIGYLGIQGPKIVQSKPPITKNPMSYNTAMITELQNYTK